MQEVKLYDTTLRDGSQAEDIAFTVEDKLRIARKIDELGIHYIEGGGRGRIPRTRSFSRRRVTFRSSTPPSSPSAAPPGPAPRRKRTAT